MVALGGATPGCPRVGIRYSRCPSPTSTWGAATSRHAAVAIILTPSPCRRRIAPATSRTPLCRPPSPPLSLSHPRRKKSQRKERENRSTLIKPTNHHYHSNPPRNHRPPHQPSSRTTTSYHAPPSRVILVKVNESKVSTEHLL